MTVRYTFNTRSEFMKIAIPVKDNRLFPHFGHCESFAVFDVNRDTKSIHNKDFLTPPPHEPGVIPQWLHELGVNVIISGGMGQRAQSLFLQKGIEVVVGAPPDISETIVTHFLNGTLATDTNHCDH